MMATNDANLSMTVPCTVVLLDNGPTLSKTNNKLVIFSVNVLSHWAEGGCHAEGIFHLLVGK